MSSEVELEIIENTQKVLGKYVKKLPLTEKLLKKPPFRFLHDLTTSIIKETGFLKGLYTDRELNSDNLKNKEDKISFLTKLITATKTITEKEINARPSKIIAGLEPTETNILLQAIGYAIENKLDSSQYVAGIKPEKKSKTTKTKDNEKIAKLVKSDIKKEKKVSPIEVKSVNSKTSITKKRDAKADTKIPKESSKKTVSKAKEKKTKKEDSPQVTPSSQESTRDNEKKQTAEETFKDPKTEEEVIIEEKPQKRMSAKLKPKLEESDTKDEILIDQLKEVVFERPKSAVRPKLEVIDLKSSEEKLSDLSSGITKSTTIKEDPLKIETNLTPTELIMEMNNEKVLRPRSSLRPPSVRPSSARPGAPRLRNENFLPQGEVVPLGKVNVIVENFSNDLDEEDTVTIQSVPELEFQEPVNLMPMPTDKGHLVEQILEQIQHDDVTEHPKHNVNIEWEHDGMRSKNVATKEIEQLKAAIQTLTKTANPLGKLINYLHEDIEAMHSELDMWTNSARQTMADVANQKRISDESNKPLQAELERIEENIIKHQQQINTIYGNILRNETRIRDLLVK